MSIGIYKITSPSGKVYIGQSWDIEKRWGAYRSLWCKGQRKLYNSFVKYGVENHEFEIINEFEESLCNQLILDYHEDLYMKIEMRKGVELLNLRMGGGSRGKHSEETKQKMSESQKGERNNFYGKKHSEEYRQKMSNYGKERFEEYRQKLSKKVKQYSKNGEFIKEFNSCREAAKETGTNYTSICSCANGRRKTAGEFIWKFD